MDAENLDAECTAYALETEALAHLAVVAKHAASLGSWVDHVRSSAHNGNLPEAGARDEMWALLSDLSDRLSKAETAAALLEALENSDGEPH